jgi:PRD1 phage membrane DNA delivery
VDSITKVALAITTVALVAVVVVNGSNSANIIKAGTGGFASSLTAAEKG